MASTPTSHGPPANAEGRDGSHIVVTFCPFRSTKPNPLTILGRAKVNTMWTMTRGIVAPTRTTDRDSEALAACVRAEYGETDADWFLAEVRRAAKKAKVRQSPDGTRTIGEAGRVPA